MGNYLGITKIKENIFSCFGPRFLDNLRENFLYTNFLNSFKTPDYSSFQSESVSLLIEEDDVPPGIEKKFRLLKTNKIKRIVE